MKETRLIMGMPITVDISDAVFSPKLFQEVFDYFVSVDERFSTYKPKSEITLINEKKISERDYSAEMKTILRLAEETKQATDGYFDMRTSGIIDPSGLVKGWAIFHAAKILKSLGVRNFYIDAGGDIQVSGANSEKKPWSIGIRDPFSPDQIIQRVFLTDQGIATSGTYVRGHHIHNPRDNNKPVADIVSLTVIGPNIYEADRFATAAFAMRKKGIEFIERLPGFEGYMVNLDGIAVRTSGFDEYTKNV